MRNTIQSSLVLEAVNRLRSHATADEVYREIVRTYPTISKGTVYRNLNRLADMGKIHRLAITGGPERFDHQTEPHYHVVCEVCQRVFDADMEYIAGLETNIRDTHGFTIHGHDVLYTGICPECSAREQADR